MRLSLKGLSLLIAMLILITSAKGQLIDLDDGTVLSLSTGLMWTKDANLAYTLGEGCYLGVGFFFGNPTDFYENLTFAGYDDWRSPTMLAFPWGSSELEVLYHDELGNPNGGPLENAGPFENVLISTDFRDYDENFNPIIVQRTHDTYWVKELSADPNHIWTFNFSNGQYLDWWMCYGTCASAWPVRNAHDWVYDCSSPTNVISAFYRSISFDETAQPDWKRLRFLCTPDAVFSSPISARRDTTVSLQNFIAMGKRMTNAGRITSLDIAETDRVRLRGLKVLSVFKCTFGTTGDLRMFNGGKNTFVLVKHTNRYWIKSVRCVPTYD